MFVLFNKPQVPLYYLVPSGRLVYFIYVKCKIFLYKKNTSEKNECFHVNEINNEVEDTIFFVNFFVILRYTAYGILVLLFYRNQSIDLQGKSVDWFETNCNSEL